MSSLLPRPRFIVLLCLLIAPMSARADIGAEVQAVLHDRLLTKASVGVEVVRLGKSSTQLEELFGHNPTEPLMPASNLKIITTSAALDRLGPDFKFRTALVKRGDDLVLIGDGDPTFGDAEMLKKVGWKITTVYEGWADRLNKLGVTTVRDLLVDDSVFDEVFFHPRWPANQSERKYMAEVGGLNLNANLLDVLVQPTSAGERVSLTLDPSTRYISLSNSCVTGTQNAVNIGREVGSNRIVVRGQSPSRGPARVSVTIHDPPMYAGTVLAETLAAAGVKFTGSIRRDRTIREQRLHAGSHGDTIIGIHETPLGAVISRANKDSVNLYAESLCKRLAYETTQHSGTWEAGTAAVGAFLKKVGVHDVEFQLDDGCGLSRQNVISPRAIVRVLAYDFYGSNHQLFADSLSVAGVDGTLEDRFRNSDLRRRIFGKSGFIDGVSTLSGLLTTRDGRWYAFSIMLNGIPGGTNSDAKLLQERIVRAIDIDTRVDRTH